MGGNTSYSLHLHLPSVAKCIRAFSAECPMTVCQCLCRQIPITGKSARCPWLHAPHSTTTSSHGHHSLLQTQTTSPSPLSHAQKSVDSAATSPHNPPSLEPWVDALKGDFEVKFSLSLFDNVKATKDTALAAATTVGERVAIMQEYNKSMADNIHVERSTRLRPSENTT
jgi:hypothetical protein